MFKMSDNNLSMKFDELAKRFKQEFDEILESELAEFKAEVAMQKT